MLKLKKPMITAASSTIGASSRTDLTDGISGAKACKQYQHGHNKRSTKQRDLVGITVNYGLMTFG